MASISTGAMKDSGELVYEVQVEDISSNTDSILYHSELYNFIMQERSELVALRMKQQVQMLDYRLLGGMSEKQAAEAINANISQIKTYTHDLRVYLRKRMKEAGI
jgi:DNA-directed RNA polymerase specialized sigma24 family protein